MALDAADRLRFAEWIATNFATTVVMIDDPGGSGQSVPSMTITASVTKTLRALGEFMGSYSYELDGGITVDQAIDSVTGDAEVCWCTTSPKMGENLYVNKVGSDVRLHLV